MPQVIYRGRRADVQRFLQRLPLILAGKSPDTTGGGVRAILVRMGMVALGIIRDAYVTRSRGDTDASGMKWAPLSPRTIAYSRRHPGLKRDTDGSQRPSSMLTDNERSTWWALYRRRKAWYKGDKSHAGASAWVALKEMGSVKTILSTYGDTKVDILKDTGRLLASLSPGINSPDQVFRLTSNAVTVGTNVEYAKAHHNGDPERNLPQRKLWPDWAQWPDEWKSQIYDAMRAGIADMIARWVSAGGRT